MKKKNIIALILAVLMCAAVLSGCGSKNETSGNDTTTFTVGFRRGIPTLRLSGRQRRICRL